MNNSNLNQNLNSNDATWYLLTECSLVEFVSEIDRGDELKSRLLFQRIRELDIPSRCVNKIEMTLTGFAREALIHSKQAGLELQGRIRVFCQKKLIDDPNIAKTSRPSHTGRTMQPVQMIHHPVTRMDGGWGYFLIERGGNDCADFPLSSYHLVDLYLYKEG
jgi:hypothetical protein